MIDYDIASAMSNILSPAVIKKSAQDNNVTGAVSNLNKAADILDNMGLYVLAEAVTSVMGSIPNAIKTAETFGDEGEVSDKKQFFKRLLSIVGSSALDLLQNSKAWPSIKPGRRPTHPQLSSDLGLGGPMSEEEQQKDEAFDKHSQELKDLVEQVGTVERQLDEDADFVNDLDTYWTIRGFVKKIGSMVYATFDRDMNKIPDAHVPLLDLYFNLEESDDNASEHGGDFVQMAMEMVVYEDEDLESTKPFDDISEEDYLAKMDPEELEQREYDREEWERTPTGDRNRGLQYDPDDESVPG